ncbi:hypothetical protein [Dactylosporangium sp. NPDC049140]|jgi:hypothetical protein|uniref:hypothetical protein n=1 Tax=Dactylosporangium sp. NPDC049140 TaxID=3155647 RepID=UPI00340355B8
MKTWGNVTAALGAAGVLLGMSSPSTASATDGAPAPVTVARYTFDGAVHATTAIPATLAITNPVPLSIGGKGDGAGNDQFHGTLDDVWIALG